MQERTCACATTSRRSWPSIPRRPPTLSTSSLRLGRAVGRGRPHGLRPQAIRSIPARRMEYLDPVTNEKVRSLLHRAVPGRGPHAAGLPLRRLRRQETLEGGGRAHGLAPAPGAGALQVRGAPCRKQARRPGHRDLRELSKHFMVEYDETGSIGKRYRRQDEIGTPLLRDRRFRHRGGRHRDRARPRRHDPGPPSGGRAACVDRRKNWFSDNRISYA